MTRRRRGLALLVAAGVVSAQAPLQPPPPTPPTPDLAARFAADIAAVRSVAAGPGDALWPGYGGASFGVLIIGGDRETLLCHPTVPADFWGGGFDRRFGCVHAFRRRSTLPDNILATMPLFGPPSVIALGTPEATGHSRAGWLRTVLHEHFHQWQSALPDYYDRVAALGLAGDDSSGMWMIDYPFPYADARVGAGFAAAAAPLLAALAARGGRDYPARLADYRAARHRLAATLAPAQWRYIDFQFWQEGVARWTEIALGALYPDPAVRLDSVRLEAWTLARVGDARLVDQGRSFAYSWGAAEAMLLDACGPAWRGRYAGGLGLTALIDAAADNCRPS